MAETKASNVTQQLLLLRDQHDRMASLLPSNWLLRYSFSRIVFSMWQERCIKMLQYTGGYHLQMLLQQMYQSHEVPLGQKDAMAEP